MAKFFAYEERLMLQRLLKEGMSFKKIAAQMYKDPATISREVRKYAVEIATGKPGYSFNACPTIDKCTLLKTFYDAEKAHLKSHQVISVSRSGLSTSEEEIARLNRIITPLVKQGHSIHEIYITHQDELMCSEVSIITGYMICKLSKCRADV